MACVHPSKQAIVIGGGLAGVSAANTMIELGGNVVLIDKSAFCGGNSTKATSGINGAGTAAQKKLGIEDSADLFISDTLKGGAKKPEIAKVLCRNSGPDVEWLMDAFSLDLSLVSRLGGHSAPRTHRGKERFPGMTITYALIQMLEKVSKCTDKARILTKSRVTKLLTNDSGDCVGVEYERANQIFRESGPVIIACGGFGADFSSDSLLAKYRPDLMQLPTTNGEHCTGDGIKMAHALGASTIDLNWVQVHPTGLVNPSDPDAKVKFLAAEALRGVGGLIFNSKGERFCNELGRRDYVTGEMWKNPQPHRLCLNEAASTEIIWHCKHYTGRGVMKHLQSGEELAKEIGCSLQTLIDQHDIHYQASLKQAQDPEGGPYDAYPSGKTWDKPSGETKSGKKFFHNVLPGSKVAKEAFYVAIITPVIHYCMGGLEITEDAEVIRGDNKKKINGLYAAGEVAGGVHGENRLGGSSLLDCVVFGRVAGKACAKYILGESNVKNISLKELTKGGLTGEVTGSSLAGGSYEDNMNTKGATAAVPAGGAPVVAAAGAPASGGYSLAEVSKHNSASDCWVVVNGNVLNVTSFLKDHPGGELAILTFAGKDATEEFNMIHPPDVIEKYAPDAVIGKLGVPGAAAVAGAAPVDQALLPAATPAIGGSLAKPLLKKKERMPDLEGEGAVGGLKGAFLYMVVAFMREIFATIFRQKNLVFTNDRTGLTRSAIFLIVFIIIHAVGNLHVFLGPDDFNGYGYFYVRLYWTGFGFNANIVELYVLLCAVLHVCVAMKRTWDITANMTLKSGQLNLAMSGVVLLVFMCIHLAQFRLAEIGETFPVRPPPYLVNMDLEDILSLRLFWTADPSVPIVHVRDIYNLEFDIFRDIHWVLFYVFSVLVFVTHMCLGWKKLVPAPSMGIPRAQQHRVIMMGYALAAVIAICYLSFPLYGHMCSPKQGYLQQNDDFYLAQNDVTQQTLSNKV